VQQQRPDATTPFLVRHAQAATLLRSWSLRSIVRIARTHAGWSIQIVTRCGVLDVDWILSL
jgi:hypothetical protein